MPKSNSNSASRRPVGPRLRFAILARDHFTCRYCGDKPPDVTLHVDHIVPVAEGGLSVEDNLAACCQDCNLGKSDRMLDRREGKPRPLDEMRDIMQQGYFVEVRTEIDWWAYVACVPGLDDLVVEVMLFAWEADWPPRKHHVCAKDRWDGADGRPGFGERLEAMDISEEDRWFVEWQLRERMPDCRGCDCFEEGPVPAGNGTGDGPKA